MITEGQLKDEPSNINHKICEICTENKAIYTCPRCSMRTCSLSCCKSHKAKFNCSGKRNVAAYVEPKDYGYFHFLSDYRYLETLDRLNDSIAKDITQNRRNAKERQRLQSRIIGVARSCGIQYRYSRSALLTRAKLNQTHITGEESPSISWTLEFCLVDPSLRGSFENPISWEKSSLKPIHILVHDCDPSQLISSIWKSKVTDLSSEEQEELAKPDLALVSDAKPSSTSVTSWILPLNAKLPFFYLEYFDKTTRQYRKYEIFPTSMSLMDVLKRENHVVREFPTLWVSQKEFTV